jgi:hypothetical protein
MTGGVLTENKGKVSVILQQHAIFWMAVEKRKGHPITLRESSKG